MAHTPIIHGSFSNDIPDKCKQCGNCIRNNEVQKLECSIHVDGKFVPKIAYTCFKRK